MNTWNISNVEWNWNAALLIAKQKKRETSASKRTAIMGKIVSFQALQWFVILTVQPLRNPRDLYTDSSTSKVHQLHYQLGNTIYFSKYKVVIIWFKKCRAKHSKIFASIAKKTPDIFNKESRKNYECRKKKQLKNEEIFFFFGSTYMIKDISKCYQYHSLTLINNHR